MPDSSEARRRREAELVRLGFTITQAYAKALEETVAALDAEVQALRKALVEARGALLWQADYAEADGRAEAKEACYRIEDALARSTAREADA